MIAELIDKTVGLFSPQRELERIAARRLLDRYRSYDGGRLDRKSKSWNAKAEAGDSPNLAEIQRAQWRTHDLYRNNCYARKAVRALVGQTIGCGLKPESQASNPRTGEPYEEFRKLAKRAWEIWARETKFYETLRLALTEVILTGEVFAKKIEGASGLTIPFAINLIESERIADDLTAPFSSARNSFIWRGIEFDENGERVRYYVRKFHPNDPRAFINALETDPVPAYEMIHLYLADRPGQQRGVTWFAPILMQLRDIRDYQDNELMAAAVGACVVAAIKTKRPWGPGALATPSGADSTDDDGNVISRMQPGMILRLKADEEDIDLLNPQRPNSSAEGFIQHLLRGLAGGLPGLKSSTITMDYRASSFSSEKSADNDCWRETEQMQEWLAMHFCQPIYEQVIDAAVAFGVFDDLDFRAFRITDYIANRSHYTAATWDGPVAKSINPGDDAAAAEKLIALGLSSPQQEAANLGNNYGDMAQQKAAAWAMLENLGIPVFEQLQAELLKAQAMPKPEPTSTRHEWQNAELLGVR